MLNPKPSCFGIQTGRGKISPRGCAGAGAVRRKADSLDDVSVPVSKKNKPQFSDLKRMATGLSSVGEDGEIADEAVLQVSPIQCTN